MAGRTCLAARAYGPAGGSWRPLGSCAQRQDWIDRTLVTVDLTGVWRGTLTTPGVNTYNVEITLAQRGAKVTGQLRYDVFSDRSGPVEGSVSGDVFHFSSLRGQPTGDLLVNENEMSGVGSSGWRIELHRSTEMK